MKSQNKLGKTFLILLVLILSSQFTLAAFTIKENADGAMGFYIDGVEKAFLNSTIFNISAPIYTTNIYSGGEEIDTSNLVPYSGANSNLDLGVYNLTAQEVIIKNGADEYKLSWEDSYPGFYAPYGDFFFGNATDQTTYINYYVGEYVDFGYSGNPQEIHMYGTLDITGNVTSDTDFCIEGGNCLSTVGMGAGNISGTGSANKIPYFTDASTISYNSNLHWDNTNSRLGIGTISPSAKLDVKVNSADDRSILLTDTVGDGTGHPRLTTSAGTLFLHSASGNFQLQSDMLPSSTNTIDMGSSARYFAEGYFNKSFAYDLQVTNHTTLNTLDVTGNVTSDTDFCIDGGNCLSTVSSADGYIGDVQTHTAGGDLNMNQNDLTTVNQITFNNSRVNIGTSTTISNSDYTIAIGHNAESTTANSISIGNDATNSGSAGSQIAIGYFADTYDQYAIAIGRDADTVGFKALSIGFQANASSAYTIAIGPGSKSTDVYGTAVGNNANANQRSSAYGTGATASGIYSVALGIDAVSSQTASIAIGNSADAYGGYGSIAIGTSAQANGGSAFAIGYLAEARTSSTAIGGSSFSDTYGSALGSYSYAASNSIAMGYNSTATGSYAIAIGSAATGVPAQALANQAIAIGRGALAQTSYSMSLGDQASATGTTATAIATRANASGDYSFALGLDTTAAGSSSVALGNYAEAYNSGNIAIGYKSLATDAQTIAIGYFANASQGQSSVSIGRSTDAGSFAIAMGYGTQSTGTNTIALGRDANAIAYDTIALGNKANATSNYAISLGYNSDATGTNSIAIGGSTYSSGGTNPGAKATGTASISMSAFAEASAHYAMALGYNTSASQTNAVAIGKNTQNNVANSLKVGGSMTHVQFDTTLDVTGNVTSDTDFCIDGGNCLSDAGAGAGNVSSTSGTDNSVPRFDTNSSTIQNSTLTIDDSGNLNASVSEGWFYFGNGGGMYWNSTHSCIVGPDGNLSQAICDVD